LDGNDLGIDSERSFASDDDALDLDSEHDLYLEFDIALEPEDKVISKPKSVHGTLDAEVAAEPSLEESMPSIPSDETDSDRAKEASATEPVAVESPEEEEDIPLTELTIDEILAPIEQMVDSSRGVETEIGIESEPEVEVEVNVQAPEHQPVADAETEPKKDFLDEPHRELEMPPKKRGFFARLFG